MSKREAYEEVLALIERHGGSMVNKAGGHGGGGVWKLELHGKTCEVECRGEQVNKLDELYVPNKPVPQTQRDYDKPYMLKRDAFWRLVALPWQ